MPKPHKQSKKIITYINSLISKGDLDQKQLHKLINDGSDDRSVSQQTISSWITGHSGPTPANVKKLVKIFPDIQDIIDTYPSTDDSSRHLSDIDTYKPTDNVLQIKIMALTNEVTLKNRIIESMEREINTLREWLHEYQGREPKKQSRGDTIAGN